jgi:Tol biopolymer transport system component
VTVTRKISGVPMVGRVTAFALGPDGTRAVYIADQAVAARFELYSVPVDGSGSPVKISTGLPFGTGDEGVSRFQISPDGSRVVFLADPNAGAGADDVFSAPIDGSSAPIQLSLATHRPVQAFGLSPDGARVAYFGADTSFGGGSVELYAAAVATAGSGRQISDARAVNAAGNVVFADFSPDSTRAIYAADAVADGVHQWFSVPLTATGPGLDVQLSAALGSVTLGEVDPSSARLVYVADERVLGVREVFSVAIAGGGKVRLDAAMAGGGATALAIAPDGTRVGYLADQNTAGVIEVYAASIAVASSGTRLNLPMSGVQLADTLNVSPDSTTVVFEADQNAPGTIELYGVPIVAGSTPATLHDLAPPYDATYFDGLGTPIIGRRAVYPVAGPVAEVYSVPFDGSEASTRLNGDLPAAHTVRDAFLPFEATRLMAYGTGPTASAVTDRVFAVPIRRDLAPEPFNAPAASGALGVLGYEISADETFAVYLQDQDVTGKPELFASELDSDADTIGNGADSCPFAGNPTQTRVVLGQTVRATSKTRFEWPVAVDVRFVRGPLSQVRVLATDLSGSLADTRRHTDPTLPANGAGLYYLYAPDCDGRSYQTELGEEPARDAAPFP